MIFGKKEKVEEKMETEPEDIKVVMFLGKKITNVQFFLKTVFSFR